MQTKAALDFIDALIKSGKSQQVINAILNGTCGLGEDNEFCTQATHDIIHGLAQSKSFNNIMGNITTSARRAFHMFGVPFEEIVAAIMVAGFVAGTQFALDGGKAEHSHGSDPTTEHKPSTLVN